MVADRTLTLSAEQAQFLLDRITDEDVDIADIGDAEFNDVVDKLKTLTD